MTRGHARTQVAQYIRKAFVDKYNGVWHCIVGRNFGSYVTHEAKNHVRPPLRLRPPPTLRARCANTPRPRSPPRMRSLLWRQVYFYTGQTAVLLFKTG